MNEHAARAGEYRALTVHSFKLAIRRARERRSRGAGKARRTGVVQRDRAGWTPRRFACRQYLNVVNGFGRRNGSKLSVVKLLF